MHLKDYKGILSQKNGMNISRGCTHGCIYCDARSHCYGMDHDFEDVEIKSNAPELLEARLRGKRKKCMIGTGAMSDPYIPLPLNLRNIRSCLEIIETYGFGLAIQTKSALILQDLDLLMRINEKARCIVQMTLTTMDEDLCRIIEPRVSTTGERVDVLKTLNRNGIETVVWLDPILPFINDTEENINGLLDCCIEAGVYGIICFAMGLTLREGNREYFYAKLDRHFPGMKQKYIHHYGTSYEVNSPRNRELMELFHRRCGENGMASDINGIFSYLSAFEEKEDNGQLNLFS